MHSDLVMASNFIVLIWHIAPHFENEERLWIGYEIDHAAEAISPQTHG